MKEVVAKGEYLNILTASPNPTTGSFNLDINANSSDIRSISIHDITGKCVKHVPVNVSQTISINEPAGIYFISVITKSGYAVQKL